MTQDQAKQLLLAVNDYHESLMGMPPADARNWDKSHWASEEGQKKADEWVLNHMAAFVVKWMKEAKVNQ